MMKYNDLISQHEYHLVDELLEIPKVHIFFDQENCGTHKIEKAKNVFCVWIIFYSVTQDDDDDDGLPIF